MRNSLIPKIAIIAVSSPLEVGAGNAHRKVLELEAVLKENKCEVVLSTAISTHQETVAIGRKLAGLFPDMVVFLPVCWFEDYLVTDFVEECGAPLLLWALPGMETGSLCGSQQLGAFLTYLGHPFFHVFGEVGDRKIIMQALKYLQASALYSRLRRSKIGLCGSRINGMTHTSPNEFMLKKSLGPRVVQIPAGKITSREDDQAIKKIWNSFKCRCGAVNVNDESGLESIRMYCGLKKLIADYDLDALTVGCYPDLMGKVCVASSLLAEEGVPLACEGDVNGAVGQLILTLLSGNPTYNADFLEPLDNDSIIFTHCGSSSLTLSEKKSVTSLNSVRLMGQGVCVLFPAKPGKVTLMNLTARENAYQCAMLSGEAVETEMVFPGNPARVKFDRPVKDVIDWTFQEGMGHHWMITYGDYSEEIRAWAQLVRNNFIFREI
jgi:L-fucose isomerase-like protein